MAKSTKHKKSIKKEKNKIKLKLGKGKNLPKGLNVTSTTFTTRKIVLPDQGKPDSEVSNNIQLKAVNVKKSLKSLEFNSVYVRQDGINELKKIAEDNVDIFSPCLEDLFASLSKLFVDVDVNLRKDSIKLIQKVLSQKSAHQIAPFFDLLAAMLSCAMNNINQGVKQDSVLVLDVYLDTVPSLVKNYAAKILRDFVDQIARKSSQAGVGRVLIVNPVSKLTTLKWRTAILKRIERLISLMNEKNIITEARLCPTVTFPDVLGKNISSGLMINCDTTLNLSVKIGDGSANVQEKFDSFASSLIPILLETWVEAMPEEKKSDCFDGSQLQSDTLEVLKSIVSVLRALTANQDDSIKGDVDVASSPEYVKLLSRLLTGFPFTTLGVTKRGNSITGSCLQENLDLLCLWIQSKVLVSNDEEEQDNFLGYIEELLENGELSGSDSMKLVQIVTGLLSDRDCPEVLLQKFLPSLVKFFRRMKSKEQVFEATLNALVKLSVLLHRRIYRIEHYQEWLNKDMPSLSLSSFAVLKGLDVITRCGFVESSVLKTVCLKIAEALESAPAPSDDKREEAKGRLAIQIVGNAASHFVLIGDTETAQVLCSSLGKSTIDRNFCCGLQLHVMSEIEAHKEGEVEFWPYLR